LFHSISSATRFLKQSTLCVGESTADPSTTICVSNFFSCQPRSYSAWSIDFATSDLLPPPSTIWLRRSRNSVSTATRSDHSAGKSCRKIAHACFHSCTS
jgi:hypothetical protein